jgi:putative heme utilization radical SAM enzyme HutW
VNPDLRCPRTTPCSEADPALHDRYFACETADPLREAFAAKQVIHPGVKSRPVPADEAADLFRRLADQPRHGPAAAYFHIPFCETRCTYCGFFNRFADPEEGHRYTLALIDELESGASTASVASGPIHAVYLGGGTPTALAPADLDRLLRAINRCLPLANDCEITIEGRVSGLSDDIVGAALGGGVNRFSIGVQSFDTRVRRAIGRIDDSGAVIAALERLCAPGRAAVVVDLVFGFPGQTMDVWERDIAALRYLPLDGADLYQLSLLPSSTLARMIRQGQSPPIAALAEQAAMFSRSVDLMEDMLWHRLSINHWRRTSRERSLYGCLVKSGAALLAFGCGAGGSLLGHRYALERNYEGYLESVAGGVKPVAMLSRPRENSVLDTLLTDGFDVGLLNLRVLEEIGGVPVRAWCGPVIEQWQRAGLLDVRGDLLRLTRAGEFWQTTLARSLIELCQWCAAGEDTKGDDSERVS